MKSYPMSFKTVSQAQSGSQANWQSGTENQNHLTTMAIPPEFDGPGTGFSPEDLYAMALQNCFVATFKVFAEKSKLNYQNLQIDAELIVDRNEKGQPWMAKIHLNVHLSGAEQKENAQRILDKVSQNCMILNSVKTEKSFQFSIS